MGGRVRRGGSKIGAMRDRATFQRAASTTDVLGNDTDGDWQDLATVWGSYKPVRAREDLEAGRTEARAAGVFRTWSTPETQQITEADRLELRGHAWQVRGIEDPDGFGRFLEFTVERGVAT